MNRDRPVESFKAKRAFDHCADDYARSRPGYPIAAIGAIVARTGSPERRIALDVGAGTGIFSRELVMARWRVIAVDPSVAMLSRIPSAPDRSSTVECGDVDGNPSPVCAMAEALPFRDGSVVLISAAQAFHWFNPPYALAEFGRVLCSGGWLALVWNDTVLCRSAFVRDFDELVRRFIPTYDREYRKQDWEAKIGQAGVFCDIDTQRFEHEWAVSKEGFVRYTRSASFIRNVLPRKDRPAFEAAVTDLFETHFGDGQGILPLAAEVWTARRL